MSIVTRFELSQTCNRWRIFKYLCNTANGEYMYRSGYFIIKDKEFPSFSYFSDSYIYNSSREAIMNVKNKYKVRVLSKNTPGCIIYEEHK